MQNKVAVIGAGLSGLATAALLAKRGFAVSVYEHSVQPGGSSGAFKRGNAIFDVGSAMMFGFGQTGFNPHSLLFNEIEEPIAVIEHSSMYRIHFAGQDVVFHADVESFLHALERLFPDDIADIRRFYAYLQHLYFDVVMKDPSLISPSEIPLVEMQKRFIKDPLTQMKIIPLLFSNAASILRRFTRSVSVMQFFDKLTSTYCYTTMEETPAIMAVTMFVENHRSGSYYIHGSTQVYVGKLEKAIEKYGGALVYDAEVVALEVEGGKVRSMSLADGRKIEADYFVYSGTVWNLYQKLLPAEVVPSALLKKVSETVPTPSSIVLYATVKKEAFPQDIGPIEMLVQDTDTLTESEITLYIPTIDDPSLNEPGYHSILAIGPSFRTWPSPEALANGDAKIRYEYEIAKQEEAERIINYLASYYPAFKAHLVNYEIGSPVTIERYSLKNKGSVAGPKQMIGQDLMHRQHAETRWKNLFCCGESTTMGTGTPAVVISGLSAADVILRREGLPEYRYFSDKGFVHYLKSPAPAYAQGGLRKIGNLCLWCEHDVCRQVCPQNMDIRGIFRRLYSENLEGARKLAKYSEDSAGELVCLNCEKTPCTKACRRKAILGESVPIPVSLAELFSRVRHRGSS